MGRAQITLYVDVVSPFAYEAFYILRNEAIFKDCDIHYVPIFLGGLMKMCGNTAPILVKNKDKWITTERLRWAKAFAVPMKEENPPDFPPLTLGVMRALCALSQLDGQKQGRLVEALDALFAEFWVRHRSTHQPEILSEVLQSVLGAEDTATVLAAAATDKAKQLLTHNTNRAFHDGGFGLPWMVCTRADGRSEGFWGVDHLGQVVQFLDLGKPDEGGWRALL